MVTQNGYGLVGAWQGNGCQIYAITTILGIVQGHTRTCCRQGKRRGCFASR